MVCLLRGFSSATVLAPVKPSPINRVACFHPTQRLRRQQWQLCWLDRRRVQAELRQLRGVRTARLAPLHASVSADMTARTIDGSASVMKLAPPHWAKEPSTLTSSANAIIDQ